MTPRHERELQAPEGPSPPEPERLRLYAITLLRLQPLIALDLLLPLPLGPELLHRPLEFLHGLGPRRGALEVLADQRQPVGLGVLHRGATLDRQQRQHRARDPEPTQIDVLAVDPESLPEYLGGPARRRRA